MHNLEELIEQFKSILIAESYLKGVHMQLETKRKERSDLVLIVDSIADGLEAKEEFNIKSLFTQTLVNESEQHEAEKQEYLLAALQYKDCCEVINILEFELNILEEKLAKKKEIESALTMLLEKERIDSRNLLPSNYERLINTNEAINDCINYKREIYEAHLVALKIKEELGNMIRHINDSKKFDNWGEFYAEIQEAKLLKKAHMDHAHSLSHQIGVLMVKLQSELTDIFEFKSKTSMTSYGELLYFQNEFHESMITDWVVSNDVISALASVKSINTYIQRIINSLVEKKEKTEIKMQYFKEKRNTIIEAT